MFSLVLRPVTAALMVAGLMPRARLLASADFILPLKNSIVPTKGSAPTACTRASSAWITDNEGKVVEVPTNCARFEGARYVRNFQAGSSRNLSHAAWIKRGTCAVTSTTIIDPEGNPTASRVTGIGVAVVDDIYTAPASSLLPLGSVPQPSLWIKRVSTTGVLRISNAASGVYGYWTVDLANLPDSWVRITVNSPYTVVNTAFSTNAGGCSFLFARHSGVDQLSVDIWETQIENVTGQADQTPSEYVSVGVLSFPFHGLGVDGVKAFTTNKDGTSIPDASLLGYKSEGARVNPVWPCSDMTHSNWVKTNVTPVLNATDVRNIPNTATTLTAAANGATITYPVALSGTRAMSIDLKRSVGTGTIEFTHDGTTWTDVTSSLSTSTFVRVRLENKTVSNPHSIGLRFGTSGDSVIACAAQDENGPTVSTRIFAQTAPMTRAADSGIVFDRGSVLVDNAGTAYAKWSTDTGESSYLVQTNVLRVDGNGIVLYDNALGTVDRCGAYDGSTTAQATGLSRANTTLRKQVTCWSETTGGSNTGLRTIPEGNTTPSTGTAYDTTMGATSTFTVGAAGFLNVRDVTLWGNRAVTDAQMVELVK